MNIFGKMKDKLIEWLNPKPNMLTPWIGGSISDESIPIEHAYCIEILNDDHTPMEFVILVLMSYFEMDNETAMKKMLEIHENGFAKIGHSTQSIMETLAEHLNAEARRFEHPLFIRAILK